MELENLENILSTPIPPTTSILVVTMIFSFFAWSAPRLQVALALKPGLARCTQIWRWLTYSLIHKDFTHLVLNMITIWSFGRGLEASLSPDSIAAIYLLGVVAPAILAHFTAFLDRSPMVVGSSAGAFALIGACAVLKPKATLLLFYVLPINLPLGAVAVLIFSVLNSFNSTSSIWHFGHAVGLAVGALVAWFILNGSI